MNIKKFIAMVVLLVVVMAQAFGAGVTYYVDSEFGKDGQSGLTKSQPWQSQP